MVLPRPRLHRRARGDADRRVLAPERRDGVVEHEPTANVVHIGGPQAAVPGRHDVLDDGAVREDRAISDPGPGEGGRREDRDVVAGGEDVVLLGRGVV